MTDFERIRLYYELKWATKEQLQKYVQFNVITPEEYKVITGEAYVQ
ncbi:XkdX family protein [Paenibacillus ehimensis]|uniref:XkdX family protein n=1 Tax=Paenibacillus ehimensis TaxID=79264 RepID=A0ABT8VMH6_9BACL|nr:XkdX family protein [Paenibacillus ehimensis]MDO3682188.1 XkdX family protein [Paenibacillus ehimensis]